MVLRAMLLAGVMCLPLLGGCNTSGERRVDDPPPYKFQNFERLSKEFAWLYADTQDMFFGVDYYDYMESRFGGSPYQ